VNVNRGGGITDGGELIEARQNTVGGKPETKVSDVRRAEITFFKVEFKVCRSNTVEEELKTFSVLRMFRVVY
jgi:hypothetical protein